MVRTAKCAAFLLVLAQTCAHNEVLADQKAKVSATLLLRQHLASLLLKCQPPKPTQFNGTQAFGLHTLKQQLLHTLMMLPANWQLGLRGLHELHGLHVLRVWHM